MKTKKNISFTENQNQLQNTWQQGNAQPQQNLWQSNNNQQAPQLTFEASWQPQQNQNQGQVPWQQNMIQQQASSGWKQNMIQQKPPMPPPQQGQIPTQWQTNNQQGNDDISNKVNQLWPVHNEICKDGNFRSGSDVNEKFDMCVNGRWVPQMCAPGTAFDVNTVRCIGKRDAGKVNRGI